MNLKKHLFFLLSGSACLSLTMAACASKKTSIVAANALPTAMFALNKKGEPYCAAMKKITNKELKKNILNHAWKWKSTHVINDEGSLVSKDYYQSLIGRSPLNYCFTNEKCIMFFFSSATGQYETQNIDFEYDEKTNRLCMGKGPRRHQYEIISIDDKEVKAIELLVNTPSNNPTFALTTFSVLQPKEAEIFMASIGVKSY